MKQLSLSWTFENRDICIPKTWNMIGYYLPVYSGERMEKKDILGNVKYISNPRGIKTHNALEKTLGRIREYVTR